MARGIFEIILRYVLYLSMNYLLYLPLSSTFFLCFQLFFVIVFLMLGTYFCLLIDCNENCILISVLGMFRVSYVTFYLKYRFYFTY